MNGVLERPVVDTITLDETILDGDLACEGTGHARGEVGHIPGELASYVLVSPCGFRRPMCNGWVAAAVVVGSFYCMHCGGTYRMFDAKLIDA